MAPALKKCLWLAMPPTAFLSLISLLTYVVFRLIYLLTAEQVLREQPEDATTSRLRTLALPWIFFGLEIIILSKASWPLAMSSTIWPQKRMLILLVPNALPYLLRILAVKPATREKLYLTGDDVPNIDVLITACDEDVRIVMDTVRAACVLDYPADRYRIFVCDDAASPELRNAVESYATQFQHLHYTARVKGRISNFKAGNLNHGLAHSASVDPLCFSWLPRL